MMKEKLIEFIENSFLRPLLLDENVTDISYNGKDIFYQHNLNGRLKSDILVSPSDVNQFLRQIANQTDSQFSRTEPILDVSVGKYRINATHLAVSRKDREMCFTFSIRIGYEKLRICDNDGFVEEKVMGFLNLALVNKISIAISGKTGSGKTEFQKYLISKLAPNSRVIIIDNIDEFDTNVFAPTIDAQTWLVPYKNNNVDANMLIRNALRSNPDWIIMGESRGKEMLTILNSAMSGHPTITTLHALSSELTYSRMTRLCMIANENLSYDEVYEDICSHFNVVVYLKTKFDHKESKIIRYVDSVTVCGLGKSKPKEIYKFPGRYKLIPKTMATVLNMTKTQLDKFNQKFVGKNLWRKSIFCI